MFRSRSTPHTSTSESDEQIKAARERQAWRESPEYARARRWSRIALASSPVGAALGALIGFFYANGSTSIRVFENQNNIVLLSSGAGAFIWLYAGIYAGLLRRQQARREFRDRMLVGEAHDELKQAEQEITSGSTDFGALWAATQRRLDYYHKIATTQAERSFMYGQIAAGAGFVVIMIAALIAAISRSTAGAIAASITGVSGGGLAAYIGATFMKSQDSAAAQLRAYFLQPLEFSKYLAAERLLPMVDEAGHANAVSNMINAIMAAPVDQSSSKQADSST